MKHPNILVIGSIMIDLVLKVDKIPLAGESYMGNGYNFIEGGKGANQAVAVARLGGMSTFGGKVGIDAYGERLKNSLTREGVNTDFLLADKEEQTGLAAIILENNGQNRIIANPSATMKLKFEDFSALFEKDFDALIMQFEMPPETLIKCCSKAKERGIPVVIDAGPAQQFELEKIQGLEIFSPNETEAYALTKIEIVDKNTACVAANILKERSQAKYIVIKLGENGAMLYDGKEYKFFPAYNIKALDTTAAGDAFTAAMTFEYIKSGNIEGAIEFATAVGALTVTKMGAQPSLPLIDEVNDFLSKN